MLHTGSSTEKRSLSSPSSTLSDLPEQPPAKKRRISPNLYGPDDDNKDDDDDEEDEPLASRVPLNIIQKPFDGSRRTANQRSGKGLKTKGLTAPTSIAPPTGTVQAEMNGQIAPHEDQPRVKVEDRMDEGQLARLATGVTVDTCRTTATTVNLSLHLLFCR
jgi:histone acetyltransferase